MAYLGRVKPTETTSSVLRSTYTGNGSTTTYALPGPVANETSIIATINGVTQQDSAYSTNGSQIIFAAAPALNDAIEIRTISDVGMSYAPMAGSVVTGTIADLAVTTGKINDGAITTAKIAAGAVVQADIGSNVAGTGPAFAAYLSSNQSISSSTTTKVNFDTEEYDTNSNFTSSRFTPTVAGYYQINAAIFFNGNANTQTVTAIYLYKNGSAYKQGSTYSTNSGTFSFSTQVVSSVVYFNGSTDYVEIYGYSVQTNPIFSGSLTQTWFNGLLLKAA
jgi:hypothetical protein